MGFLTGILRILDAAGNRVDTPDSSGDFRPITLKLAAGLSAVCEQTDDGFSTVTVTGSGGGGGTSIALSDHAAFRALPSMLDGTVVSFQDPEGVWIYSSGKGAGTADDDRDVLKLTATSLGSNGRLFRANATIFNTMSDLRVRGLLTNQPTIALLGYYAPRDNGAWVYDYDPADTTSTDNGGSVLVIGARRYKGRIFGNTVTSEQFGMKADDPAFNNAAPLMTALTFCAGKYRLQVSKGTYWFWQTVLPSDLTVANTTCNITFPSETRMRGAGRGLTIFRPRTPLNTGGGDPTVPADIPMIPHTRTAMLRSHTYAGNSFAFINGHSYYTASGGATSANPSDAPSGVFLTPHVDGTVSWEFADTPFRGGVSMQVANNALDVVLEDFTLDGGAPWVDNVAPPPYRLSGTYLLYNTPAASVPLMYAEKSYNQVTYAYGWDVFHKGFNIGDSSFAPQGIQRLQLNRVEITRFRGEGFYDSGYDLASPHNTIECTDCEFSEGPTSFSSFAGGKFIRCRFRHLDQGVDISRGIADLEFNDCDMDDCRDGLSAELGLLDQSTPGVCWWHHSRFRNVYGSPLKWLNSFSFNHSFTGGRRLRYEDNEHTDCGWQTASSAPVFFVSGPDVTNPPEATKVRTAGMSIARNKVHIGALQAPTRSGGGTASACTAPWNFGGWLADLEFNDNEFIRDQAAIDAGHVFNGAGAWNVKSNSQNLYVRRNKFRGGTAQQGIFTVDTVSDQFLGLWQENILVLEDATQEWPITLGGYNAYTNGSNLFPKLPVWYARGAGGSVLTTVAGITHPERWAPGQIVELRNDDEGSPLLIPAESATHTFATPRLLTPRTRLFIRRGSTSNSTDTPHWYEAAYLSSDEMTADFIGPLHPPNVAIESYAPAIECWGVHIVHLAPSGLTSFGYLNHAPDEDGLRVQVYCNTNTKLLHGSAVAPAGTVGFPKLLLIGGVDYTFATGGESHFIVDNDTGLAVEVLRIDGSIVLTAQGISAANATITVTGGTAIAATGDFFTNTKKLLSPGFFLGVDDPRTPQWASVAFSWGENLAGAGGIRYFFGQAAHQGSGLAGGDLQVEGGAPDGTGLAGAAHLAAGDAGGVHNRRGVSCGETAGHAVAISFYGSALVAKQTRAGQLADSTTGTPAATLVDVGAAPTQANVNNNFASVLAKLNAIETILHNLGLNT